MKEALNLVLNDLNTVNSELQRNEEIGEKRFSYFVTFVTAVSAGLVALFDPDIAVKGSVKEKVVAWAVLALFGFGLLTYVRLRHRNSVTDGLKEMTRVLHCRAINLCPELDVVEDRLRWPKPVGLAKYFRAGYAEVIGLIDGALLAVVLSLWLKMPAYWAATCGGLLALILWRLAIKRGESAVRGPYFRAGVGAVIRNAEGLVLALERRDMRDAWQLPQGGIEAGEDPVGAVSREIREETGLSSRALKSISRYPEPLSYELPKRLRTTKTGRGQTQWWFVFDLRPGETIELPKEGEFRDFRWTNIVELTRETVEFRRPLYRRLADWLGELPSPTAK